MTTLLQLLLLMMTLLRRATEGSVGLAAPLPRIPPQRTASAAAAWQVPPRAGGEAGQQAVEGRQCARCVMGRTRGRVQL